jgi:predicted nucleic acid-binding protein
VVGQKDKQVVDWLDKQPRSSIWTTSVTIVEIRFGLQILTVGKRRSALIQSFEKVLDKIERRLAPFDTTAARQAGDLMALPHKKGRPGEPRDTMIAGIVLACHAMLATRNISHFEDLSVPVVNPLGPPDSGDDSYVHRMRSRHKKTRHLSIRMVRGFAGTLLKPKEIWLRKHDSFTDCEGREQAQEGNPGLLLRLLFLGTFDVHRTDEAALLRRMRLLRLGHTRQKIRIL